VALAEQVAVLYAGTQGYIDKVPVGRVREWEAGFVRFLKAEQADLLAEIEKTKALDDKLFERLKSAIATFNQQFGVEGTKAEVPPVKGPEVPPGTGSRPEVPSGTPPEAPAKPVPEIAPEPAPAEVPTKPQPETPTQPDKSRAAAPDDESGGRSQLNQIRAALADQPSKEPKDPRPRPSTRKPKAK
jgi:hypothetical protein